MESNVTSRSKHKNRAASVRRFLIIAILVILVLIGLALITISYLETSEYEKEVTQEVHSFQDWVAVYVSGSIPATEPESNAPTHHEKLYNAMERYNQDIFLSGQAELVDDGSYQAKVLNLKNYDYNLDAIGLVSIPSIDIEMPLYLGASYENLAKGFAQFSQTSMPIGGESTNCVIAGHRGWNGMPYLRDVDKLSIGDSILLQNPWEVLEYRISEIQLIDPWDINCLYIQPGRELLTIITCHPYGVGSHRYVLICDRYYPETEPPVFASPTQGHWEWELHTSVSITATETAEQKSSQILIFVSKYLPWICAVLAFMSLMSIFFIRNIFRKKRKKHKYERR